MDDDDIPGLIGDVLRIGVVESVDLTAGRAVVRCGEVVSPPLHWCELAGTWRSWFPPSTGEQVLLFCPEGEIAAGVILRGLFTTANPAPASGPDPVLAGPNGLRITFKGDGLEITAPGVIAINGDVTIEGDVDVTGTLTASEDVIGGGKSLKSHKHGQVQAGGAQTGTPV